MASATLCLANPSLQVNGKGLGEFSGLCNSSNSLPFRKSSDDLLSVIAFQTSAQLNIISIIGNGNSDRRRSVVTKCESTSTTSSSEAGRSDDSSSRLAIGSAIIVVEAPKTIKTAASVPCLRVNTGLVKPGDVGRIVARKPKDVWAVRLAIGTYLIDGKHFKPLDLGQ